MNAVITSLKFHPGHFSHLVANYKLFEENGFVSYLYVNDLFNPMDEENKFNKINSAKQLQALNQVDVAVFWFPSLKNIIEILRLRYFYNSKIFYVYHEPFESVKSYYSSGFRFKKILKICLIHLVNIPVLLFSHKVILPSLSSFELYKKKYTFLNANYTHISLLFDDEALEINSLDKVFVSYIGTIAADHAFDRYVEFVEAAVTNSWLPDMQFLIATSSTIPSQQNEILAPLMSSGRVVISSGRQMKNGEINKFYQKSRVVWNAYNRSMQSGVLPKAFMFGAAVILLRRNANEFLDNYKTGILINANDNFEEIRKAIEEIVSKKEYYFQNCRNKFFEKFYYKNNAKDYLSLIEDSKDLEKS